MVGGVDFAAAAADGVVAGLLMALCWVENVVGGEEVEGGESLLLLLSVRA